MQWVPQERNIFSAVHCAWQFQKSFPAIFQSGKVDVCPGFKNIVSDLTKSTVVIREDDKLRIPGYLLKVKGKSEYQIVLSSSQTTCWKRFTLCKELCHMLTDDSSVYARNVTDQIAHAIKVRDAFRVTSELNSEEFCFILAIELMIPLQRRAEIRRKIKESESHFNIANSLKIPEWIINYYYKIALLADTTDVIRVALAHHDEEMQPIAD